MPNLSCSVKGSPSWVCTVCDVSVPHSYRYNSQAARISGKSHLAKARAGDVNCVVESTVPKEVRECRHASGSTSLIRIGFCEGGGLLAVHYLRCGREYGFYGISSERNCPLGKNSGPETGQPPTWEYC